MSGIHAHWNIICPTKLLSFFLRLYPCIIFQVYTYLHAVAHCDFLILIPGLFWLTGWFTVSAFSYWVLNSYAARVSKANTFSPSFVVSLDSFLIWHLWTVSARFPFHVFSCCGQPVRCISKRSECRRQGSWHNCLFPSPAAYSRFGQWLYFSIAAAPLGGSTLTFLLSPDFCHRFSILAS